MHTSCVTAELLFMSVANGTTGCYGEALCPCDDEASQWLCDRCFSGQMTVVCHNFIKHCSSLLLLIC